MKKGLRSLNHSAFPFIRSQPKGVSPRIVTFHSRAGPSARHLSIVQPGLNPKCHNSRTDPFSFSGSRSGPAGNRAGVPDARPPKTSPNSFVTARGVDFARHDRIWLAWFEAKRDQSSG